MPRPLIVGLAGRAGAGKSTIAAALRDWLLEDETVGLFSSVLIHNFAGPLKKGLAVMGITKLDTPHLYREYAQKVGAGCRAYDPDHWVKQFRKSIDALTCLPSGSPHEPIIIADDVRYLNEVGVCDFVFFINPDFAPMAWLSAEQVAHESEDMARKGFDPAVHHREIRNRLNEPMVAAAEIGSEILAFLAVK